MPTTKSINQQTYNAIATQYEEHYGNIPDAIEYARYIADHVKRKHHLRVLDLGCGTGTLLHLFEENFPLAKCVGVDFSKELLRIAKSKLHNTTLMCQDFSTYTPSQKFNVILATFSLIHSSTQELEEMMAKIYEWLCDDGYVLASFILGDGEHIVPEALNPQHQTYFHFYSETYLKDFFAKNHFRIEKEKIVHHRDEYENEDDLYVVLRK